MIVPNPFVSDSIEASPVVGVASEPRSATREGGAKGSLGTSAAPSVGDVDYSVNPFLPRVATAQQEGEQQVAAEVSVIPHCGSPSCKRSHRSDGTHYSRDPKLRYEQLVEEGRIGPQYGHLGNLGKDKKTRRAAEVVAEMAAEHSSNIKQVFLDGIDDGQPISVRIQAAKEILKVESEEEMLALKQRAQDFDQMTRGELTDEILAMLKQLSGAGTLAQEVIDIRAEDVVEIEE